jgi:hypothetical protein
MFELDKIQVAGQLGRAEEDRYKDFDANPLPEAEIASIDVHEEDMPDLPCAKPTFISALRYAPAEGFGIALIQVDYEKDEVIDIRMVGRHTRPFPDGFLTDWCVRKAIHLQIKNLPEYVADRELYEYAKAVRSHKEE